MNYFLITNQLNELFKSYQKTFKDFFNYVILQLVIIIMITLA
jgi:hypothetical protein